ncbi:hypothetical protein BDR26DRAFT_24287 [Obelidium mucronatum]|nr:hypothetical protein BDR26DRAFT_24287 [Obelidium mucronatum]
MFASKETGFQKVAPPTLNRLFEALLFPSLNADAQFKLSKEDLLAAVAGFLLKVCSTTTVSTIYSDALSGAMCHDISTVFSTGIRFRLDGTPLSIDEYIVFCGRSAELLEYFSSLDIKSPSLKSKLSDLTETLILGSIEKMKAQNEYTKAAIQMFAGLITSNVIISTSVIQALNSFINESMENLITSEPEAIRLIGAILKLSSSAQQEFHLLLLRKIVASKNLDALKEYTTKSLTCSIPRVSLPDLDELVIELFKNKSVQGRDLVIQSLVVKDGVAGVSQGAVNVVSELIHGSIEDFLAACLSGEEQNEDRVLFDLRLMEDLSRSSVASLWALPNMSLILCDVLQIASFKFIIDNHVDVSDLALSLWKHGTSWSAGHSSLLNVGVTKWRSQLLDDEYPATSSDFILFYQRLKDMCSNEPSLLSHLCQSLPSERGGLDHVNSKLYDLVSISCHH